MPRSSRSRTYESVAGWLLARLKANGVDYLFANAGTDFPSIIESLARDPASAPKPVICAHENAAVSMAHGYAMVTGRPQAAMVHVNVGTANTVCGVLNAERERIPLLIMAGRTPLLEDGPLGRRSLNIHWAQEMFDQGGLVREAVRWDYELRDGRQTATVVDRAFAIAKSVPQGPVYLSLPREVLAAEATIDEDSSPPRMAPAGAGRPDRHAVEMAARILSTARNPLIIASSAGRQPGAATALADFAARYAIPVVEYRPRYVNLPGDHPMHAGFEVSPHIGKADAILAIECDVPWIPATDAPKRDLPVISIGEDPLFTRYPVRGFPSDVTVRAAVPVALEDLAGTLGEPDAGIEARFKKLEKRNREAKKAFRRQIAPHHEDGTITIAWASQCLGAAAARSTGSSAVFVNEYPLVRDTFDIVEPGGFYGSSPSGGLGWGFPAALGAKLAQPDRLVIAALGDGSYLFANPAVCHQIAAANDLPLLVVLFNNSAWAAVERATKAMYPDGAAISANVMPLTSLKPSPDYEMFAEACGGWGRRVDDAEELPLVLDEAIKAVIDEKRLALVNVICRA